MRDGERPADPSIPDRGQLVLLAAAVAVTAMVPMALAYLTLGAHPDVAASAEMDRPSAETVRALDRAVANASDAVDGAPWASRAATVGRFDAVLGPDVEDIESARLAETVAVDVRRNATAATESADSACPSGPNRAFGACAVHDGVVVQERAGGTTLLAVAVDVTVTSPDGVTSLTVVVRVR